MADGGCCGDQLLDQGGARPKIKDPGHGGQEQQAEGEELEEQTLLALPMAAPLRLVIGGGTAGVLRGDVPVQAAVGTSTAPLRLSAIVQSPGMVAPAQQRPAEERRQRAEPY